MGLFEKLFPRPKKPAADEQYFLLFNGYSPVFTTAGGCIYEKGLIRAAINANATACSKLEPEISGDAPDSVKNALKIRMNEFMVTSQFLYRLATILFVENTAFITPVEDYYGNLTGFYPVLPSTAKMVESQGKQYLRFRFGNGQTTAIEWEKVGVLTRYQYENDIFGSSNAALSPTIRLIDAQTDGIINGVKSSANVRFLGRVANFIDDEDLAKAREKFVEQNLGPSNNGGIILTDNRITDITPIDSKPITVNAAQMKQIEENGFDYFGCSQAIIQNTYNEDQWNAYYEGCIEPIAIQLSQVMTSMAFSREEIAGGNKIMFTADWLQYASNRTKKAIITDLFDRGFLTLNEGRKIMNMSRVEEPWADEHWIRKEYAQISKQSDDKEDTDAGEDGTDVPGYEPAADPADDGSSEKED
ncbi:MAG: phage portal protein [Anaerolineaceae bacterium]|nr:phage portal protein [Anaerolineaceae bacterium]